MYHTAQVLLPNYYSVLYLGLFRVGFLNFKNISETSMRCFIHNNHRSQSVCLTTQLVNVKSQERAADINPSPLGQEEEGLLA